MEGNIRSREKITLSLDASLIRRGKHLAVDRKADLSSIVEEALRRYLPSLEKKVKG